jgi:hypothetical protein
MARKYGLESVSDEQLVDFALYQYQGYMEGFLKHKHRIRPQNFIEIRYEDFVADRMGWLRTLYDKLALGDFAAMAGPLQEYIRTIENYEPHRFPDDPALRGRIDAQLGFAVAALGYQTVPGSAATC